MGDGRGVENTENTQKSQRSHKYKWEPLDKKKYLREVGRGVDVSYKSHQGEHIPLSQNRIPGPGALRQ